ncbi:MAG TPA: phosphate ABC transporter permease PstA [Cellulomonadaceae bacterium]|nr:phosphate ABC transporter permease PstA [Cellulomonadaceae bacterium]
MFEKTRGRRRFVDRLMTTLVTGAVAVAMIPLVSVAWTVGSRGLKRLNGTFLTTTMRGVFGGMDAGGIQHAIIGTLLITLAAAVISVPIGLLCAIYLVEYGRGRLAAAVTFFVDVMTGIPSIVAGLFAYALFTLLLGPGARAGIVGSVALSVLMIPVVVRSSEEMLRLVPNELREAALALGVPKWLMILKVVVRTAIAGITTGVMLAFARVIGETAPLLITVGVADSMNANLFAGRMMTLPVYVFGQYREGLVPCSSRATSCIPTINFDRAWATALVLILIVMGLNLIGRLITRFFAPKTGR